MPKKILSIVVLLLIVVVGGGGYLLWMQQANQAKASVEQLLSLATGGPVNIAYDSIETSGFPTKMVITLTNPRLHGNFDRLIDPQNLRGLPAWRDDIALEGTMNVSINLLSSRYNLQMYGKWKGTGTIDEHNFAWASQEAGTLECSLEVNNGAALTGALWDFSALKQHGNDLLRDFRLFDCYTSPYAVVLQQTGETIMKSGTVRFYVSSDPQGDERQIRFYSKSEGIEFTPEGDRLFSLYSRAFSKYPTTSVLSAYGKQDGEVDFTYKGPISFQQNPFQLPLEIHLGKFYATNDAYTINMTMDLTNNASAETRSSRFAFRSDSTYSEIYGPLIEDSIRATIRQAFESNESGFPVMDGLKTRHTPESFYALVTPAIPDFHGLGNNVAALDVSYQGTPDFATGDVTLSAFEISSTPYGITGTGTGKRAAGNPMPTVNANFICRNCLQMIDDTCNWIVHLQTIAAELQPDSGVVPLSPEQIKGYKKFARAMAGAPDGQADFAYNISTDPAKGGYIINQRNLQNVMMLWQQYMPQER